MTCRACHVGKWQWRRRRPHLSGAQQARCTAQGAEQVGRHRARPAFTRARKGNENGERGQIPLIVALRTLLIATRNDNKCGRRGMATHDRSSVRVGQSTPTEKRLSFDGVKYRFDFGKWQTHADHRHY
jgi:hypothetical protein